MGIRKRLRDIFLGGATQASAQFRPNAYSYPMELPPHCDDLIKVSFPQADTDFSPALFWPTEKWKGGGRAGFRHLKNAFTTLYATMEDMGCIVNRSPVEDSDYVFNWSGKHVDYKENSASLILEHGWLPRFSYQLSECGSNACSHVAADYRHKDLTAAEEAVVRSFIKRMRLLFQQNLPAEIPLSLQDPFVLVPFQLATDFNLRFSKSSFTQYYSKEASHNLDFAQAVVDYVENTDLPCRVIYKQHPGDRCDLANNLRFSDKRSQLIVNDDGVSTHQLFASGLCQLVVSVNSNTLHEGLTWGVPAVALGTMVWNDDTCDVRPLPGDLKNIQSFIDISIMDDARCLSYLSHLMRHQWYLSDFQNPLIVSEILKTRGRCEPYRLRMELGLEL